MQNKLLKWRIFKREFEWYDVKTKFKQLSRRFLYTNLMQDLICNIIATYMWLVYITSKKQIINSEKFIAEIKNNRSIIMVFWHNRLMMIPFMAKYAMSFNKNYRFMTLSSHHGDGRFVGIVLQKFGFQNLFGSSKNGRKANRGIALHAMRDLLRGLKSGKGLGITPDGPRGPNQKINSAVISIAKMSNSLIAPVSYSSSRFIQFNSWDKFKLPLPFSKINFYFGEFFDYSEFDLEGEENLKIDLENRLNETQEKSQLF